MPTMQRLIRIAGMLFVATGFITACDPGTNHVAMSSNSASRALSDPETKATAAIGKIDADSHPKRGSSLTIRGFNYTDTYISSFSVNGVGGGNIEVSDRQSGGGGGACCARLPAEARFPLPIEIAWKRDGDAPYCKQTVLLEGPTPAKPYALDVHFYQDGTIQVAISEFEANVRVKMDRFNYVQRKATGNANNDAKFSRCGS